TLVMQGPSAPATTTSMLSFFQAKGVEKKSRGGGDKTEDIKIHEVPLKGVDRWLQKMECRGMVVDPKVYAGLYFLKKKEKTSCRV
ncbi:MAG: DNA mismatch repair protein MutT, partial [Candidatus Omnitrophica bacterium]|nr:DNA mismatch repair protein MutT [Candidatus Omnitrophota bacterium]